jgi:hypothetical protein
MARMLLYLSSASREHWCDGRSLEEAKQPPSQKAFETPANLAIGSSLRLTPGHVAPRFLVVRQTAEDDGVKRTIEQPITAPVEAVAGDLPRGGRQRRGSGHHRKGGF